MTSRSGRYGYIPLRRVNTGVAYPETLAMGPMTSAWKAECPRKTVWAPREDARYGTGVATAGVPASVSSSSVMIPS
jgi:hypothetical protein